MTTSTPRPRGRPRSDNKAQRVQITLSPETLALINAQPGKRSTLIEALIVRAFGGGTADHSADSVDPRDSR